LRVFGRGAGHAMGQAGGWNPAAGAARRRVGLSSLEDRGAPSRSLGYAFGNHRTASGPWCRGAAGAVDHGPWSGPLLPRIVPGYHHSDLRSGEMGGRWTGCGVIWRMPRSPVRRARRAGTGTPGRGTKVSMGQTARRPASGGGRGTRGPRRMVTACPLGRRTAFVRVLGAPGNCSGGRKRGPRRASRAAMTSFGPGPGGREKARSSRNQASAPRRPPRTRNRGSSDSYGFW